MLPGLSNEEMSKKCRRCGRVHADHVTVCELDGEPLTLAEPMEESSREVNGGGQSDLAMAQLAAWEDAAKERNENALVRGILWIGAGIFFTIYGQHLITFTLHPFFLIALAALFFGLYKLICGCLNLERRKPRDAERLKSRRFRTRRFKLK